MKKGKKKFKLIVSKKVKYPSVSKDVLIHRFVEILAKAENVGALGEVNHFMGYFDFLISEKEKKRFTVKKKLSVISGNQAASYNAI